MKLNQRDPGGKVRLIHQVVCNGSPVDLQHPLADGDWVMTICIMGFLWLLGKYAAWFTNLSIFLVVYWQYNIFNTVLPGSGQDVF